MATSANSETESSQDKWLKKRHASLIEEALALLNSNETASISHLREGLRRYLQGRTETGGFLRCVLENDFSGAVARAHPTMFLGQMKTLNDVLLRMPGEAWGSPEKVAAWLHPETKGDTDA